MATAAQPASVHMRSMDLIRKEPLDYGGFGEVYLCYHVTLGQVVLKTLYTGLLRNEESKKSLLEEGNIMASLNHERVVKLLGVIMEDRDCSLVIELLPRGNLLTMLETVSVPVSIKGRIILEILEGMVYLTKNHIIHMDIKPENILVDKDFHIKLGDLGLATYQTWSKLSKQESRKKGRSRSSGGRRGAGTLSYMAPEHLESIHTVSSEKSDIYSFAIVVWVILSGEEPYRNARSEDHISQCVRNGDRPAEDLIPDDTPAEIIDLMKRCWDTDPQKRPTNQECYNSFLPFYKERLESHVDGDLYVLRQRYKGPEELIEKMKSLSITQHALSESERDSPAPLRSSDRAASMPVEASVEDLNVIHYQPPLEWIQSDSKAPSSSSALEGKLSRELQYHKNGSYNNQPDSANCDNTSYAKVVLPNHRRASDHTIRQPLQEKSSVQSWTKAEPVQPITQEAACYCPTETLIDCTNVSSPTHSHLSLSYSNPSLSHFNQQHPHSHIDRQQSWPADVKPQSKCGPQQDQGSLYIQNASGIQIGSNNTMSIQGFDPSTSLSANFPIKERIRKYDSQAVTEKHLDLLRDNIGQKWKRCARRLGLESVEIETIDHDYYRDGLPEMVHQMLERWKMKEGSIGCTIGKLCRALEGNIKVDVIQKILDVCESS